MLSPTSPLMGVGGLGWSVGAGPATASGEGQERALELVEHEVFPLGLGALVRRSPAAPHSVRCDTEALTRAPRFARRFQGAYGMGSEGPCGTQADPPRTRHVPTRHGGARQAHVYDRRRTPPEPRTCPGCGTEFVTTNHASQEPPSPVPGGMVGRVIPLPCGALTTSRPTS
jgi:hypothetical protein